MDVALVDDYKAYLCYFCRLSAYLEDVKKKVENGVDISSDEFYACLEDMEIAKRKLLLIKEKLGISGGLDFMDNVNFQGFQYVDGELSGDYTNLEKILIPWVEGFDIKNPYKYEVGVLLLFHYMKQTGKDSVKKAKQKRRFCMKSFFKKIFSKFKIFVHEWFEEISFDEDVSFEPLDYKEE